MGRRKTTSEVVEEEAAVPQYEFWRHEPSGEVYAVQVNPAGVPERACGPIEPHEQRNQNLRHFAYGADLQAWLDESRDEFLTIDPELERQVAADQAAATARETASPMNDATFRVTIHQLEAAVGAAEQQMTELRESFKRAKQAFDQSLTALRRFIQQRETPLPLFDHAPAEDVDGGGAHHAA